MRDSLLGRWGQGGNLRAPSLPADYFSEHLGVYRPVLAALESLNRAVLTAMDTTKLVSERSCSDECRAPNEFRGSAVLWEPPLA